MNTCRSPDCCVCVCKSSSSDVSEHVEIGRCTFSCLTASVQVAAIMAGPASLQRETSPEPERFIRSCAHNGLLVWTEGDMENTILVT